MNKHAPVILQLSDTECGLASLAMIFAYYKVHVPLEELRSQSSVARDGCKASTLMNIASHYGFVAEAYQIEIEDVRELTAPVIAYWSFSHYVVINGVKRGNVYLNDPAFGAVRVSMEEFSRSFTGVIINLSPTDTVKRRKSTNGFTRAIYDFGKTHCSALFFILACLLIMGLSPYLNSSIYRAIIDNNTSSTELTNQLVLASATLYLMLGISTFLQKNIQYRLMTASCINQTANVFLHILKLPMLFYALRQRSEIIATASRIENQLNLFSKSTTNALSASIITLMCFASMLALNCQLAGYSLILSLLFIVLYMIIIKLKISTEKSNINANAKLCAHATTAIRNLESVQVCGLEETTLQTWNKLFLRKLQSQDATQTLDILNSVLLKSYNAISIFLILLVGNSSIGGLWAYFTLHLIFYANITIFIKSISDLQTAYLQHERTHDIEQQKIDRRHTVTPTLTSQQSRVAISCRNLSFSYNPNHTYTLNNINLEIEHLQNIAFIGKTGSGKSTLAKLLCGLYPASQGEIQLFGKNVPDYTASELAKICAYVSQDITLFSSSIYENLTLGAAIPIDTIYKSLKVACLESFILERGLHQTIDNLSGGERQRIEIARALLQNTPILILDEATSALDDHTQEKLITNLREVNKTIIYVAHRLEAIRHCDQVIKFKNGQLLRHENQSF